jgi:DNA polymerase I-like protein with 3'-5' exonuclease and polymerase domains
VAKHKPIPIDLETASISEHPRPGSPPPGGLAIQMPGKPEMYLSWGHASENGVFTLDKKGNTVKSKSITDPKRAAALMLKDAFKHPGGILGHNVAKFDLPVIEDHLKIKPPAWDKVDDTLFTMFLRDPHATTLSLKPAAERWLGEEPTERDAVYDWLAVHGIIAKPRTEKGVVKYAKDAGAHILKAPGSLVAAYAIGDIARARGLHELHMPWVVEKKMRAAYDVERELAPILLDNERRGVRVDMKALERDLGIYEAALKKADTWLRKKLKSPGLNLDSDDDVAAALRKSGVVKKFPQTPGGKDSISKKNLTEDFFEDPRVTVKGFDGKMAKHSGVWLALYYRNALANVLSHSIRKWFEEGSQKGGYIFRDWNQVRQANGNGAKGARSGRITVSDFQNITKDYSDKGDGYAHPAFMEVPELPLVRKYILADAGEIFGHSDVDQQEMKLVAHYEDGALAEAYRRNPKTDIHVDVQKMIFDVTGKQYERRPVKVVDFRTVYGGGKSGLAEHLKIPYEEASDLIDNWRRALPDVVDLDSSLKKTFKAGGYIRTLGGRIYYVKPPAMAKKGPMKGRMIEFSYTALNYLIQPSAADQTKKAIIDYHKHPKRKARMLVTVHDEVNISMKDPKELKVLQECMIGAYKLDVPVTTTLKMGPSWGNLTKIEAKEKAA